MPWPSFRSCSAARRRPLAASVVGLAVALSASGCGTDEEAAPAPTVSATTAAPGSVAPQPDATTTPDDALVVSITVGGGRVSGVEPRTPVPLGSRVRLTVTSDAADQLHVHGYDLTEQVTAGQAVQLEFVADRPGVFEVELHDARTVLTRLQVQ